MMQLVQQPALQAGCDETTDALWKLFIDRVVRSNLHVCMWCWRSGPSDRGQLKKEIAAGGCMYIQDRLVNCTTTIDWFHTWPSEALQEVAMKVIVMLKTSYTTYMLFIRFSA